MKKTLLIVLVLLAVAAAPSAHGQEKLAAGPYVVNVTPKAATVVWIVETGQTAFGTSPDKLEESGPALRVKKTTMTNLKPGTRYFYSVTGTEEGKGSFETASTGAVPFQFVVYGDTRTRHEVHQEVIDALLKHSAPDFALHTGDLVANGMDTALWPTFFHIEEGLLRKTAFFPAFGNHERNDHNFYDFFDLGSTPYYSFNWGSSHFIVLDSDLKNVSKSDPARKAFWDEQVRWLEQDLQEHQSSEFRFVVAHHPPLTAVARRQGQNPHMTALMPLFEKYKVTAGFFGHDHNYQHYLKNGVHYFITGGGGAPLYDVDKPPPGITVKVARTENFLVVNVDRKGVHVRAFKPDGKVLDSADLKP